MGKAIAPAALKAAGRDRLLAELHNRPHEFVAQEPVVVSLAPAYGARSEPVALRLFVNFDGRDYTVLPGGLGRVLPEGTIAASPRLQPGRSKDVWVIADDLRELEPVASVASLSPIVERGASDLPSRTAENFFWLGRYVERLEGTIRVCRCVLGHLIGERSRSRGAVLAKLIDQLDLKPPGLAEAEGSRGGLQAVVLAQLNEERDAGGIRATLNRIQAAAFAVRDRLSADTWRVLNRLTSGARSPAGQMPLVHAADRLNGLMVHLLAFSGLEMENMTRSHGWMFLELGRRLERGIQTARLVEVSCGSGGTELLLEPLLEIADSVMTYRRRYFAEVRIEGVIELLLADSTNPRSLGFQVAALQRLAAGLPDRANPGGTAAIRDRLAGLNARAAQLPANAVPEMLAAFGAELGALSDLLTQVYFIHVVPRVS
jgi:uncharacterized alpha-E superfamily protein